MKILITGSSGFIGSHLVESLISKKYSVTVLAPYDIDNSIGWLKSIKFRKKIKEKEEELNDCPYLMDQIKKMKSQTISLRESKRFYRNKGLAYEYYMDKTYRQN